MPTIKENILNQVINCNNQPVEAVLKATDCSSLAVLKRMLDELFDRSDYSFAGGIFYFFGTQEYVDEVAHMSAKVKKKKPNPDKEYEEGRPLPQALLFKRMFKRPLRGESLG